MKKYTHLSGKRKMAIARATAKSGKGIVRINHLLIGAYEPELAREKIMEPIIIAGKLAENVDINVNVYGGGWHGRAEAARLAIARALVKYSGNENLKRQFLDYDRHLLIADVRRAESSKPNDSKPRKARHK